MNLIFKNILLICFLLIFNLLVSFKLYPNYLCNSTINDSSDIRKHSEKYIHHHIKDSHSLIFGYDVKKNHQYAIPLPIIFWDQGLIIIISNNFNNGKNIFKKNKYCYRLYNEKIYKTNLIGDLKIDNNGNPTVEKIVLDFSITKNVVAILIVAILMLCLFIYLSNSYQKTEIPIGIGRLLEPLIMYICNEIAIPNIGLKKYKHFINYLLTVFFFILFLNILGLFPFGFNATGNIVITFSLSLFTYIITQCNANINYWKHIFWMPGVPILMKFFLIPIELLGTLTKPFALMLRLFANISAGHIVILTLISMIYIFPKIFSIPSFSLLTLFIYFIEILVSVLQAYVFTMLSALFIGMSVNQDH